MTLNFPNICQTDRQGRHLFPSAKLTFSSQWLSQDISLFLHEISLSLEISVYKSLSLLNSHASRSNPTRAILNFFFLKNLRDLDLYKQKFQETEKEGTQQIFIGGGSAPRSNPLALYTIFRGLK